MSLPVWIRQQPATTIPLLIRQSAGLDPGEMAALSLAMEIHADAILVDERRGHQVALELGLRAVGILGILLQAKAAGAVAAICPVIDRLEREAQFWIAPALRRRVLDLAAE